MTDVSEGGAPEAQELPDDAKRCLTCGAPGMEMTQTWASNEGSGESRFTVPWCSQHPPMRPNPSPGLVMGQPSGVHAGEPMGLGTPEYEAGYRAGYNYCTAMRNEAARVDASSVLSPSGVQSQAPTLSAQERRSVSALIMHFDAEAENVSEREAQRYEDGLIARCLRMALLSGSSLRVPDATQTLSDEVRDFYLSGPMTGYAEFNYPAFAANTKRLRDAGHTVWNPAEHFAGRTDMQYADYIKADVAQVMLSRAVAVLPGWEKSKGAALEVHLARVLGLPVVDAITLAEVPVVRVPDAPLPHKEEE